MKLGTTISVAAVFVALAPNPASAADAAHGKTVLGPSLKGIVGRPSGAIAGFSYSPALTARGITWTPANLDAFITSPTKYAPGTRMPFAGLPDARDRADLIAYLEQAAH